MITSEYQIVLCDPNISVAQAYSFAFQATSAMSILAAHSDGNTLIEFLKHQSCDLLISEIHLGNTTIFDVAVLLTELDIHPRIVVFTEQLSEHHLERSVTQGFHGYLLKSQPLQEITESLRQIVRNRPVFPHEQEGRIYYFDPKHTRYKLKPGRRWNDLSIRQVEVLKQLALGLSVKEIAKTMHLSPKSIDSHKYRIMHKLDIHDRVELARFAIRNHLTEP